MVIPYDPDDLNNPNDSMDEELKKLIEESYEREMQDVIEKSPQTIKMKEDMERWRKHCSEQGRMTTPEEAFAAGWRASLVHRLSELVEQSSLSLGHCPECGHEFNVKLS